jgi:glutamate N-acetyltransferase/amino-acid N-acetyltransferase
LISVDGDMSTNDTILALANGVAATSSPTKTAVEEIDKDRDEESCEEELTTSSVDLARVVVRD